MLRRHRMPDQHCTLLLSHAFFECGQCRDIVGRGLGANLFKSAVIVGEASQHSRFERVLYDTWNVRADVARIQGLSIAGLQERVKWNRISGHLEQAGEPDVGAFALQLYDFDHCDPLDTFDAGGISEKEMRDIEWAKIPMGKPADPAEMASALHFLATDDSSYMTGATLDVNGGCGFY